MGVLAQDPGSIPGSRFIIMGEYAKRRKNKEIQYSQSWKNKEKEAQKTLDEFEKKKKEKEVF